MSGSVAPERWYLTGPLGISTDFNEPSDAQSAPWGSAGTGVRLDTSAETLNLLDGRPAAANQGPNLSLWGLNAGRKAVRLAAIGARFGVTTDGAASGHLAFSTKPPEQPLVEQLRITERGHLGIGTSTPENAENWSRVVDVVGTNHAKLSLRTAAVETRVQVHDSGFWGGPAGMILGTRTPHALSLATASATRLRISSAGDVDLVSPGQMTLTVGAGANGVLKARHVNGKHWQNDSHEGLFLNYGTGFPVHVGGGGAVSSLVVSGDVQLDPGRTLRSPGRLHVAGDELLYLLNRNGVIVSRAAGGNGNLLVEGEARVNDRLVLGAARSWIVGFDGGSANGYHWIKTVDDESRMWMGFAMSGGFPSRIELGPPMYGTFYGTLYGTVRNPSDARLKSDVQELTGVLGRLDALRGVSFLRQAPAHPLRPGPECGTVPGPPRREIGVIAQEVETVFPELVAADAGTDTKTVDYAGLTGVLLQAVKALRDELRETQGRLAALEGRASGPA
jgi:hypothetical protein